jgi:hypothetical protein
MSRKGVTGYIRCVGRRGAAAVAAVVLVAATGVAAVASPPGTNAGGQKAVLAVLGDSPLTVRGSRFVPGERVKVTVYPAARRKTAVAGRRGGFTVQFAAVHDPCRAYRVVAVGARGSRAAVREVPPPCVPIAP